MVNLQTYSVEIMMKIQLYGICQGGGGGGPKVKNLTLGGGGVGIFSGTSDTFFQDFVPSKTLAMSTKASKR